MAQEDSAAFNPAPALAGSPQPNAQLHPTTAQNPAPARVRPPRIEISSWLLTSDGGYITISGAPVPIP